MIGRLKTWVHGRGFGFIEIGQDKDVFVHVSALADSGISTMPDLDGWYEFSIGKDARSGRNCAINLRLLTREEREVEEAYRVRAEDKPVQAEPEPIPDGEHVKHNAGIVARSHSGGGAEKCFWPATWKPAGCRKHHKQGQFS